MGGSFRALGAVQKQHAQGTWCENRDAVIYGRTVCCQVNWVWQWIATIWDYTPITSCAQRPREIVPCYQLIMCLLHCILDTTSYSVQNKLTRNTFSGSHTHPALADATSMRLVLLKASRPDLVSARHSITTPCLVLLLCSHLARLATLPQSAKHSIALQHLVLC